MSIHVYVYMMCVGVDTGRCGASGLLSTTWSGVALAGGRVGCAAGEERGALHDPYRFNDSSHIYAYNASASS